MSRIPTICHLLHSLDVGGAERLAKQFALQAADRFRPVFLCLDELGSLGLQLQEDGFQVEVAGRKPGFDFQCVRRISSFMKRHEVGLVHAHQYGPFFYAAVARWLGKGYSILFTEHGRDFPDYRRTKRVWANQILLRRSDRVTAVGQVVKQALIDNEGIASNRIEVIFNGVDPAPYEYSSDQRQCVRKELGLAEDSLAVVHVARLNRLKDFETALRAISIVRRLFPNICYVVVGEGDQLDNMQQLIRELQLQDNVKLLGLRSDISRLLSGMDVALLSSISEGIPLTLIEAMLASLPCVATRVGGVGEVVQDGETGLLAEPARPSDLAELLIRLFRSPSHRARMGASGRERALERFQSSRMHAAYQSLYGSMLRTLVGCDNRSAGTPRNEIVNEVG